MRNLPLILLACVIFLFSLSTVWAQSIPVSGNNLSGTITTTNTFQSIQGSTNNRNGCTVQNKAPFTSGDLQYVYFDSTNSSNCSAATIAGSSVLLPGWTASCTVAGNLILKDQVCITGISGDSFFANFQ
jgi:hypothetical protein